MRSLPLVSIVIPFYDDPYVDQAIRSAVAQTYPNVEIVVVSDGATKHVERIGPFLPRVRFVEKPNGGTATALNAGIRHASGEWFSWLSSDDVYSPRKVERQVEFLQARGARIGHTAFSLIDSESALIHERQGIGSLSRLAMARMLREVCPINGCTVMVHMSVFDRVGLFDESLPYTHDYDLWMRILPRFPIPFLDEPLVYYRVHPAMGTKRHAVAIAREIELTRRRRRPDLRRARWQGLRDLLRTA